MHTPTATSPPARFVAELRANWHADRIPAWVLLPLRLFLSITFIYAGLQKLTDIHFWHPGTPDYIGRQIYGFAAGSPLHNFLLSVAEPHAVLFGALVAYGELAVGLGVLLGVLMRPAAFGGLLLSVLFFLSASWRVHPYFYGADIVFAFAWVPIILAGPAHGILPAVDTRLVPWLLPRVPAAQRERVAHVLAVVLGIAPVEAPAAAPTVAAPAPAGAKGQRPAPRPSARQAPRRPVRTTTRRDFIWGTAAGAAGMLSLTWLWSLLNPSSAATVNSAANTGSTGSTTTSSAAATPGTTSATGTAETIAQVSAVPVNSAATFTLQANGDPGVLVHLTNGKFVAFDATCTHQGCPVQYDPSSRLLLCPCHGAAFDPSQNAAVVQGPAYQPLTPVTISINQQSGAITTQD